MIGGRAIPRTSHAASGVTLASRWGLPVVVLVYGLLAAIWSVVVPLGEGPDESGHLRYALHLQATGRLPVQTDDPETGDVPGEGHQPPLAYLLMQPAVFWLAEPATDFQLYGNPRFRWNGGLEPNAYLHGVRERPPYRGVVLAWHLARLLSVALGAGSILLCWLTARYIWPATPGIALGAAAVIGWNPQWIFHHALVSNDPLLIALASLLIYLSVVMAQRPLDEGTRTNRQDAKTELNYPSPLGVLGVLAVRFPSFVSHWWLPLLCGVVLGLMLITKQSGLALIPVPLLGLFLGRRSLGEWARRSAVVVIVAAVIAGWWHVRNSRLYGDPLGFEVFQLTFASGGFVAPDATGWSAGLWNLLRSSSGMFGWMTVALPDGFYLFVRAALIVGLAGLVSAGSIAAWHGRGASLLVLLLAMGLVLAWTSMFAIAAGAVAWQGRFLLPAAPALAILLAVGLAQALPRRAALWSVAGLWLVLSIALPWTVIQPSYYSPGLPAGAVPAGSIYARFDPGWKRGIELHDATFARVVPMGDDFPVALTWHLVEPVDRSWTVFLHLVDQQENIVASVDAIPFDGRHPTNAWTPGDWYRDRYQLPLRGVAPGAYRLRLGFFDPRSTERLGVYRQAGTLTGDFVDLGQVDILKLDN